MVSSTTEPIGTGLIRKRDKVGAKYGSSLSCKGAILTWETDSRTGGETEEATTKLYTAAYAGQSPAKTY